MNAVAKLFPDKNPKAEADTVPAALRSMRAAIAAVSDRQLRAAERKLIEAREARAAWSAAIEQARDEDARWRRNFKISGIIPLSAAQTAVGRTAIQRYEKLNGEAEGHDRAIRAAIDDIDAARQDYLAALYAGVRKDLKGIADVFSAAVRALEDAQVVLNEVDQVAWSNARGGGALDSLGREHAIRRLSRHTATLKQSVERI